MAIFHPQTGERLDTETENVVAEPKATSEKPGAQDDSKPAEKAGKSKATSEKPAAGPAKES